MNDKTRELREALVAAKELEKEIANASRYTPEARRRLMQQRLKTIVAALPQHPAPQAEATAPDASVLTCEDCPAPYGDERWIEAVVSDEDWEAIMPDRNGGGILCISCMAARFLKLGRGKDVAVRLLGTEPFVVSPEAVAPDVREAAAKLMRAIRDEYHATLKLPGGGLSPLSPNGLWSIGCEAVERALSQSPQPTSVVPVELREALRECADKLWIARCDSRDAAFREAAERACDMATAALHQQAQPAPDDEDGPTIDLSKCPPPKLSNVVQGMIDDHMTSEKHHPDYVLVPAHLFDWLKHLVAQPVAGDMVMVPREPTEAMAQAALAEMSGPTDFDPKASAWDAVRAYRAMLTAAQQQEASNVDGK